MISCKVLAAVFLAAVIGTAQSINIRGVVNDTAGDAIAGAMVRLQMANIATMTDSNGRFTLKNIPVQVQQKAKGSTGSVSPVQFQNGKIAIKLSGESPVVITIHDVGGRLIYSWKQTRGPGSLALQLPMRTAGIYLLKVTIGNAAYVFKSSPSGTFSTVHGMVRGSTFTFAKQAKPVGEIYDILFIVKERYISYRDYLTTYDKNDIVVVLFPGAGNVTDADGNVYSYIRLGNQIWTAENLRTTRYNDGTAIQRVTEPGVEGGTTGWRNLSVGGYCYYENTAIPIDQWEVLYNWFAVDTRKLAPKGWHVPTDAEWDTLQNYLIAHGYNWDGTTGENKIAKSMAIMNWAPVSDPVTDSGAIGNDRSKNNSSGFSGYPSGVRDWSGFFGGMGFGCNWWSATEENAGDAWNRALTHCYEYLDRRTYNKHCGYSVRLVRD